MYKNNYNINNWYWIVDNSPTQVFSSANRGYISQNDAAYLDWIAAGGKATRISSTDLPGVVNAPIIAQIEQVERGKIRALTDIAIGNPYASGSPALTPEQRLQSIEIQLDNLREQLVS